MFNKLVNVLKIILWFLGFVWMYMFFTAGLTFFPKIIDLTLEAQTRFTNPKTVFLINLIPLWAWVTFVVMFIVGQYLLLKQGYYGVKWAGNWLYERRKAHAS